MDSEKLIKTIFTILFVIFVTIYISQATGYYEYELHKKSELTKEQIQKFEKDVKEGKKVDLKKYSEYNKKDYSNKFSKAGNKFSNFTSKYVKKGIEGTFKIIDSLLSLIFIFKVTDDIPKLFK